MAVNYRDNIDHKLQSPINDGDYVITSKINADIRKRAYSRLPAVQENTTLNFRTPVVSPSYTVSDNDNHSINANGPVKNTDNIGNSCFENNRENLPLVSEGYSAGVLLGFSSEQGPHLLIIYNFNPDE
ncbi:hypothetical protein NADFUDRAFT_52700 [Nadsonia fulvescens var. elongata DSM 6958]|uniref:Uncharacterized protein n=1 Tax=Nadsonia fulvescens var. elongata DSM 6958 TaxID=857566 RepID=A0A1E3PG43_9ASCO|nr:hypothetical protein NADFUDRAFT_52700 [Nadsonia fulvescens var. elongata DSM 6958]